MRGKFYPKDVVAIITIIGFLWLLSKGFNGWIQSAFMAILIYYFARREDINGGKK